MRETLHVLLAWEIIQKVLTIDFLIFFGEYTDRCRLRRCGLKELGFPTFFLQSLLILHWFMFVTETTITRIVHLKLVQLNESVLRSGHHQHNLINRNMFLYFQYAFSNPSTYLSEVIMSSMHFK